VKDWQKQGGGEKKHWAKLERPERPILRPSGYKKDFPGEGGKPKKERELIRKESGSMKAIRITWGGKKKNIC